MEARIIIDLFIIIGSIDYYYNILHSDKISNFCIK